MPTFNGRSEARFTVPSGVTASCTTNAGGPTSVPITAGTYFLSAFITQLQTDLNSGRSVSGGTWTVALSTGASGTGKVTIAVTNGTYSITWSSTDLRDLLGFTGNISSQSTSTGGSQARGLWIPDCPIAMDSYYLSAPRATDLRMTESPTGFVIGHVGNQKYRHRNVRWSHVPYNRTWLAAESTTNESLERFLIDTQWGLGHAWFTPSSKVDVYAHDGNHVGNSTVAGWYWKGVESMDVATKRASDGWEGLWSVGVAEFVSDS